MNPLIGAGIIAGASGLVGSGINYVSQRKTNEQAYKYNKKLSELAFEQNKEMWRMQNEYNTPSEQVARLRAAGINPALAYGSGNMSGNAEAAPELAYSEWNPKAPYFDLNSPISSALSASQVAARNQELGSKIDLNLANAAKALESAGLTKQQKEFFIQTFADQVVRYRIENSKLGIEIEEATARLDNLNVDADLKREALKWMPQLKQVEYDMAVSNLSISRSQQRIVERQLSNLELEGQRVQQVLDGYWKKYEAELKQIKAYTSLLSQQGELTKAQTEDFRNRMQSAETYKKEYEAKIAEIAAKAHLTEKEVNWYFWNHGAWPALQLGVNFLDSSLDRTQRGINSVLPFFGNISY